MTPEEDKELESQLQTSWEDLAGIGNKSQDKPGQPQQ